MKYGRVLFVCTGNPCRSPMAEAIYKDMVDKEHALRTCCVNSVNGATSDGRSLQSEHIYQEGKS